MMSSDKLTNMVSLSPVRMASRDRDMDENGVAVVDHADKRRESVVESDNEKLTEPLSWNRRLTHASSDLDIEYAEACRQMATNDKKHSTDDIETEK